MAEQNTLIPVIPPNMPQVPANRFTRWFGRTVLRLGGWRVVGELPNEPKLVIIIAPHSSNWDGIWGMAAKLAIGIKATILGKDQLFWWPLSTLLYKLGVVPVNRSAAHGVVGQAVKMIQSSEQMWFAVAPEGTRKPVTKWKTGFWKIAKGADVPVLMAYLNYTDKTLGFGPLFYLSDDPDADMAAIREWYRPWQGKNRGTV